MQQALITARHPPKETTPDQHFIAADITQPQQVDQLAQTITVMVSGSDILVDNTGAVTVPCGDFSTLSDYD